MGEFGAPVSVDLSAIVERMRSPEIKAEASKVAAITLHSRLMAEQGSPRYYIIDNDRLPYLIFSATFGKDGLNKPTRFTSLLQLLSELFEPSSVHKKENFWTTTAIQQELGKHLKQSDVPNLTVLGKSIKKLRWRKNKNNGIKGYYLRLRKS